MASSTASPRPYLYVRVPAAPVADLLYAPPPPRSSLRLHPLPKTTLVQLREALVAAVKKRMMSDVAWGVLLSGGLDSSLIASIACREYRKDPANTAPIHSFCIGLDGSPDIAAAAAVAKVLGTKHHSMTFTLQDGLDAISDVIFHLETFDTTTIRAATPMFLMSRKIKAHGIKMVLSGEGADEIFGGYA